MGYTFIPIDLPSEVDAIRVRYDRMIDATVEGMQMDRELSATYLDAISAFTFEVNVAGIAQLRKAMTKLGMLSGGDHVPFPEWPGSQHLVDPVTWQKYEVAERAAMEQLGDAPQIARFKLMSNGPWIVTSGEVLASLDAYASVSEGERSSYEEDDLWNAWVHWLRKTFAGFEVR